MIRRGTSLTHVLRYLTLTAALSLFAARAPGQCPSWQEGPLGAAPIGVTGNPFSSFPEATVTASVNWDHDENAATPNWLIVGGTFLSAGGVPVQHVAAWDGSRFLPLGQGLSVPPGADYAVTGLTLSLGYVFAAGSFGLRLFNGSNWIEGIPAPPGGPCRALTALGSIVTVANESGDILAWDTPTNQWVTLGSVPEGSTIYDLAWRSNELVVCGDFSEINGTPAAGVARWLNGVWTALGTGLANSEGPVAVYDLTLDAVTNNIWLVGRFDSAGGVPASGVARWTGASWVDVPVNPSFASGVATCVSTGLPDRRLVVARVPDSPADPISSVWRFDEQSWHAIPGVFDGTVERLGLRNPSSTTSGEEEVVIGGSFTSVEGRVVQSLATLTSVDEWEAFRSPVTAYAISSAGAYTFGGGDFRVFTPDGLASRIVGTSGTTAFPLRGPLGEGVNGSVYALHARVVAGAIEVFVGGDFTEAGGIAVNRVAKFTLPDGASTGTWSALSSGFNDAVLTITEHNGEIYAGGEFTTSGLSPRPYVARWTGSSWASVGLGLITGLNGPVHALKSFNGQLHATGEFTGVGFGNNFGGIARWTGSAWQALTTNALLGTGRSLVVDGSTLVVGGTFAAAGGIGGTSGLARWSGTSWSSIGGGLSGNVFALASGDGFLWAGGDFLNAGDPMATLTRFDGSAWSLPGELQAPNLTVRALLARAINPTTSEIDVLGRFTHIGESGDVGNGPTLPFASWARISFANACCVGDLDGTGTVDGADLAGLLGLWGPVPPGTLADVNGDLVVDGADLAAMLGGWGGCP